MSRLAITLLEDRTTPSSAWLGDFTGPILPREDLEAHPRLQEPFTGPQLPPDEPRVLINPVMPPDWKLDLTPAVELNETTIGDPIILPPAVPLIPPDYMKPIGDPIILPPTEASAVSQLSPRVDSVAWPTTPPKPVDLMPTWITDC